MKRICMVAFTNYSTDSRVRREAEALVERGDEVDVISLREKEMGKIRKINGVRNVQLSIDKYRGSSVIRYLVKYIQFFFAASFYVTYLHLKTPYQIIHVHTMPDFMVFVAIIPKFLGARVILDVHDLTPELYQSKFGLDRSHWLIRFITLVERWSVRFSHKAIAVHKPHLDTLVEHGNPAEKFIILLNLPDPSIFSEQAEVVSENRRCFNLIYHGTVSRRHGLHVALNALSNLKKDIKSPRFQIIGDGDDIRYLIELTKELDLNDCVKIVEGFVSMEELIPIILDADIGIIPILYDNFTKLMLPVKLLEYVALGIPVISSRTETIEAYFDDSMVQYFEPGNADDLAEKILEVYRNPDRRESMRANANKFNRNHTWGQHKQRLYRLVDELGRKD